MAPNQRCVSTKPGFAGEKPLGRLHNSNSVPIGSPDTYITGKGWPPDYRAFMRTLMSTGLAVKGAVVTRASTPVAA